jgi:uncharacterized protein
VVNRSDLFPNKDVPEGCVFYYKNAEVRRRVNVPQLFRRCLPALVAGLLLAAVGAAVADPLQDGSLAYQRKDYETALNIWRPLAEQGNPEAQRWLGRLYDSE